MKPEHGAMAIILAKMAKKGEPYAEEKEMPEAEEEMNSEEGMDEGKMAAADEMMMALENKDSKAFAEALEAFIMQCC